jgi:hypothetical protein
MVNVSPAVVKREVVEVVANEVDHEVEVVDGVLVVENSSRSGNISSSNCSCTLQFVAPCTTTTSCGRFQPSRTT